MIASKNKNHNLGYDMEEIKALLDSVLDGADVYEVFDETGEYFWDYFGDIYEGNEKLINLINYATISGVIDNLDTADELTTFLEYHLFITEEAAELLFEIFVYIRDRWINADLNEEDEFDFIEEYMNTTHTVEWNGVYSFEDEYPDNYLEARVNTKFSFHVVDEDMFNEQILSDYFFNNTEEIDDAIYSIIGEDLDVLYEEFIDEYDDFSEVDSYDFLQDYLSRVTEFCDESGLELDNYSFEPDDDICFDEYEEDDYEDYDEYDEDIDDDDEY